MNSTVIDDWKIVTKESYNTHAKAFASFSQVYRGKLQRWIHEFAKQVKKGGLVLDIGCGSGRDAFYLTESGLRVIGIDFSEELIEIARSKVPKAQFMVADFEHLEFPQKYFSGIWANASLLHVPKDRVLPVLKELRTLLADNGLFFINMRVGQEEKVTHEVRGNAQLSRFYAYYQPRELESLLRKAGFTEIIQELDQIETGSWISFFARR